MRQTDKNIKAFTLIELLVVISIIGLLMSIIMPALWAARKSAARIVCKSNIRQLQLANQGYVSENKGHYVPAARDIWGENLYRWHGTRKNKNEPFDPLLGPLSAYLGEGGVKRCPAFKKSDYYAASGQSNANFEAGCGGYGYNDYIGGNTMTGTGDSVKAAAVKNPSSTIMFTDTAYRQKIKGSGTAFIEYSFAHPPYWQWYLDMQSRMPAGPPPSSIGARPEPTIHFRHGKFTNTVWCDGHVSNDTMDLSAPYVTNAIMSEKQTAQMALGWFGPDNNSLFDLK
ncbi:type II secretion system protein G [Limihaloglobus sulfuriphilus]|uniref:Type II secretion system protein G n=1 Tax=Limihaloglobus sulfuriphilus TaxID=1851148 RepID=A0A1Q2MDS3_9BACT|nr:type II secretion system protein [Limihaloglobus sulfuriphilus]AQQ70799.1 type II secretion system protein G [Limihaloglobus sulfuriphilus]